MPSGRWAGLVMNTEDAPFDNPHVRKAIRMPADRDILGKLFYGEDSYAVSCDHPVCQQPLKLGILIFQAFSRAASDTSKPPGLDFSL